MLKIKLYGLFAEEIAAALHPFGFEKYRASQVADWIYRRGIIQFEAMTNLSKQQREILAEHFAIDEPRVVEKQQSSDKRTEKFLFALADGATIETVLMRQPYGNSVCISTQVGCAMGCVFCASTLNGIIRDLDCGEMLAQIAYINKLLAIEGQKVDSVVIMGMGEPLANYEQVVRFIRLCRQPYCYEMSYRSFTLSTSGIVPSILKLAAEELPVTLAVSLHAPNDLLRSQLMPINRQYPIASVLQAADYYAQQTGRRVTYEYILIAGMNDSKENAVELAKLLHGRLAHVNLIPINPVPEKGLARPDAKTIAQFEAILRQKQISVTLRREMGTEIQAACGQLRRRVPGRL
ncbi:MAG: Ribosomal large subunit methyltransferase [Anaerosporomusa subterranea]|jgi:23S rRNA (adenine2503-C2)-methyltransferase|nr:Ribosomal large subunit methyltransferase [Anaerosporomusa subterranea]